MNLDRIIAVRNNKTIYRDSDRCLKVFGESYSKADVLNEALNQAIAEQTGLRVPKILEVTTVNSRWTIISEYIKGDTLEQLMNQNPGKANEYIERLADIQINIQNQNCPLLNKLKDKLDNSIKKTDLPATIRFDLYSKLENMSKTVKTCHGDLNPSNIVIQSNSLAYITDWSHAAKGSPNADAARTFLWLLYNMDENSAEQYLKQFCKKSSTDIFLIKQWIPIVAAATLPKANAAEREFLRSKII